MDEREVVLEGYPELSKQEFIEKFFKNCDTTKPLWVIRFEVVSAKNEEKNNSTFYILNSTFSSTTALNIAEIRRDGGTQAREKLDLNHVATLKEAIADGAELDPVVVFYDGENYWLADGFHRCKASEESELEDIQALIHQGTRRDAVLYSVGANAEHKAVKPRSRADKRRAVMMLL
ncbi:MAG: ParB N-terminal domain-containing protein, partial [Symploca sp. SIO2G7]|nr:ParB N-terminal domain-containing protein [Symploca sp. SIO2G7]